MMPTPRLAAALAVLLAYAVLTTWIDQPWAWAIFQTGIFTLAAAYACRIAFRRAPAGASFLLLPIAGAAAWGLGQLAAHRTVYRWATWKSVLTWTTWLIVFFLTSQFLRDRALRRSFLRAVAIFGFVVSVIAMLQMFTSGGKVLWLFPSGFPDYVLGPFVSRNQYAAFIELLVPVALYQSLRDRERAFVWSAMAGAMFASVVAAASRAGVVLLAIEIPAVLALARSRTQPSGARGPARAFAAFLLPAVICTAVVGWDRAWQRFRDPDPYAGRREMLQSSLEMIHERPWTGFGLGTWPVAYPSHAHYDDGNFVNQAHNDWAQWTVEGGIPFLLLLLALAAAAIPLALRSPWGLGVIAVMAHSLVDYPFEQHPATGAWFFALLGALAAARDKHL